MFITFKVTSRATCSSGDYKHEQDAPEPTQRHSLDFLWLMKTYRADGSVVPWLISAFNCDLALAETVIGGKDANGAGGGHAD